jgi:membrane-bound ClpP family serine protease
MALSVYHGAGKGIDIKDSLISDYSTYIADLQSYQDRNVELLSKLVDLNKSLEDIQTSGFDNMVNSLDDLIDAIEDMNKDNTVKVERAVG